MSFKSLKRSKSFNFLLSDSNRSTMKTDFLKDLKTENQNNVKIGRSKHRKSSLNDNPTSSSLDTFSKNEKILLRSKALKRKWWVILLQTIFCKIIKYLKNSSQESYIDAKQTKTNIDDFETKISQRDEEIKEQGKKIFNLYFRKKT